MGFIFWKQWQLEFERRNKFTDDERVDDFGQCGIPLNFLVPSWVVSDNIICNKILCDFISGFRFVDNNEDIMSLIKSFSLLKLSTEHKVL